MLSSSWLLWTGLFCVVILLAMCFTNVRLQLYARRHQKYDDAKIKIILLFGLISFSFRLPKFRINERGVGFSLKKPRGDNALYELEVKDAITKYEIWTEALEVIGEYKEWFRKLLNKVELSNWKWNSTAGTGDAMSTALSCGALWSVKGMLFGQLSCFVKVINSPEVSIEPHFQQKLFSSQWSCELKVNLGILLITSTYLITHLALLRKTRHLLGLIISRA